MLVDMLMVFIIVSILLFVFSVFLMDEQPILTIPFVFAGMIFTVISTYGFFNVETFYVGQNVTTGNFEAFNYVDTSYATVYPWVFFFLFILYVFIFIRVGFNLWKEAMETEGKIDYFKRR